MMTLRNVWIYALCILFYASCDKTEKGLIPDENPVRGENKEKDDDFNVPGNNENSNEEKLYYVAHQARGNSTGEEESHASDFLNDAFWVKVQSTLQTRPVTVKFAAGNYDRAYTTKTLRLINMGHANHRLTLEGTAGTVFRAITGYATKSLMVSVVDSENITIRNFHFTGDGLINYVFRVSSTETGVCKNILIEECSWQDMGGIVYGTAGVQQPNTSHITFKNCTFKRIGRDGGSHMIYNAYGAQYISVIDSHFEDCKGDYVRFRANLDYGLVRGCTFVRSSGFTALIKPFISIPLFNSSDPGKEFFATNYSFTNNTFTNEVTAIRFYHSGFDPVGRNHLLTAAEGAVLTGGTAQQKRNLLLQNFGLDMERIRMSNNTYNGIGNQVTIYSGTGSGGATSKGWTGEVVISNLVNSSSQPFSWEP